MTISKISLPACVCVLAIVLAGCTVVPPRVAVSGPAVVMAPMPPPPMRVEVVSVAPQNDYFWIPGYWQWGGDRHYWVGGHWERQRPHERWEPHRWQPDNRGNWRLEGGYWRR
ncbi:MAG: YXWGXW repeat-containing protein [Betaproteobacteria bacterium]